MRNKKRLKKEYFTVKAKYKVGNILLYDNNIYHFMFLAIFVTKEISHFCVIFLSFGILNKRKTFYHIHMVTSVKTVDITFVVF